MNHVAANQPGRRDVLSDEGSDHQSDQEEEVNR